MSKGYKNVGQFEKKLALGNHCVYRQMTAMPKTDPQHNTTAKLTHSFTHPPSSSTM